MRVYKPSGRTYFMVDWGSGNKPWPDARQKITTPFKQRRPADQLATALEAARAADSRERYDQALLNAGMKAELGASSSMPDLVARWHMTVGGDPKNRNQALDLVQRLVRGIRAHRPQDISRDRCEAWLDAERYEAGGEKRAYGDSWRKAVAHNARSFTRWLVDEGYLQRDPLARFRGLKGRSKEPKWQRFALSEPDCAKLVDAARRRPAAEYLRTHPNASPDLLAHLQRVGEERALLYAVAAHTGLRRNELATLTWSDLVEDESGRAVVVVRRSNSKNRKEQVVTLAEAALLALRKLQKRRFRERRAGPTDRLFDVPRDICDRLRRDFEFAGLKMPTAKPGEPPFKLDFHCFRHTAATWMDQANAPLAARKQRMRHSDLSTTSRYTHAVDDHVFALAEQLPDIFSSTEGAPEGAHGGPYLTSAETT